MTFELNAPGLHQQLVGQIPPTQLNYPNEDRNVSKHVKPSTSSNEKTTEFTQQRSLWEGGYISTLKNNFPHTDTKPALVPDLHDSHKFFYKTETTPSLLNRPPNDPYPSSYNPF